MANSKYMKTATTHKPLTMNRIQDFFSSTYKSKFVRNVAVVASGTAGAQAIVIAFAPIITRLYGPEAFGILGTFMAIVAVVTPIAALSYPIAIVLPKEDSDARGIARLSAYIALGMATLVAIVLLIFGDRIVELLQVQAISSFIWLLPLVILFVAWLQINQQWVIRKKLFGVKARVAVIQAFLVNGAKAGMGLEKPLAAVLIVVYAVGQALHAALLTFGAKRAEGQEDQKEKRGQHSSIKELARRHYDFPLYRAPNEFINAISQGLPILMLAAFFGPASAGFYAICKRVLNSPTLLIGKSVGEVFYPKIVEISHNKGKLTSYILKATLGLAGIGIIPFSMVIVFGPYLFGFIFGEEWTFAGEYARWLALVTFFQFINSPSVKSIPVLGEQPFLLFYSVSTAILRIMALAAGFIIFSSDIYAIALFSIVGMIMYIFLISYVLLKSQQFIE